MTDAEIVCGFMEPKPDLPMYWTGVQSSSGRWWILGAINGGGMQWFPGVGLTLDALHKVEARLTDEQQRVYIDTVRRRSGTPNPGTWHYLHATAEQKLAALARVLEGAAVDPR